MTLDRYLEKCRLTQGEFAALIGVTQGTVSRWLPQEGRSPLRRPSLGVIRRIRDVTGGQVTADDFLDMPEDDEPPATGQAA